MPSGWSCFNSQVMSIFQPLSSAHYKPEFWYQDATFLSPFHRGTHIPEDLQVELAWLPGLTLRVTCQSSPACPSQSLLLAWSHYAQPGPGEYGILKGAGSPVLG